MGLGRIQTHFVLLIGVVLFLTLILNLIPVYFEAENNMRVPTRLSVLTLQNRSLLTAKVSKKRNINIWKPEYGADRIVEQLELSPNIDENLPPKRIIVQNGVEGWSVKHGKAQFVEHKCKVQNCELISRPVHGERYDARMLKEIDLNSYTFESINRETQRHPEQVWIMFALESPEASPSYNGLNDVINWTATYRHQSTINTPYDKWVPYDNVSESDSKVSKKNYAEGKSKLGAMFVSNCNAANNRLQYIHELQKYVEVDVFGYCGDKQCNKNPQNSCFEMLRKDYKFYFSFENANCRDYITEKFFLNALR
jgi:glycoprotein 3-alpha-L-fucosyltransferase